MRMLEIGANLMTPRHGRCAMAETAAPATGAKRAAPTAVPGTTWFGAMVALWSIFFTLLAVSPETLEKVYDWLIGLAIVWEVLMWVVLLPWAVAYVVWESSWDHWLRVLVVVLITIVHLAVSTPKKTR
ncbi:MAG TPA: hypothetical protein VK926_00870 [Gaiellaceae bacterium]|nr:hypothetical protein [Gaiellaceae bacterium]